MVVGRWLSLREPLFVRGRAAAILSGSVFQRSEGSAVREVLNHPLARLSIVRDGLLLLPEILRLMIWSAHGLELLFSPVALVQISTAVAGDVVYACRATGS